MQTVFQNSVLSSGHDADGIVVSEAITVQQLKLSVTDAKFSFCAVIAALTISTGVIIHVEIVAVKLQILKKRVSEIFCT